MKILLVSTSSGSRGGGELYLLYLAAGLRENGHEVALWTSSDQSMNELCKKFSQIGTILRSDYTNTYKRKLRLLSISNHRKYLKLIKDQWLSWNPDIIHLNKQNLEDGLDLIYMISKIKKPSICTIHITQSAQSLGAKLGLIRDWISKQSLIKYKGSFVTVAESCNQNLELFLSPSKSSIQTINNAVPARNIKSFTSTRSLCRQNLCVQHNETLFVTVGRLVDQKRPFYFLEVAKSIVRYQSQSQFIWIGDGPLREQWEHSIHQDRSLSTKIQCLGWQDDVIPWLAAADFYIHTAQYEGLPFSVLEALSLNLPCLITENLLEEIPEFKAPGILPLESSISQIHDLVQGTSLKELQQHASELFETKFSISSMIQQYEDLYRSCLSPKQS